MLELWHLYTLVAVGIKARPVRAVLILTFLICFFTFAAFGCYYIGALVGILASLLTYSVKLTADDYIDKLIDNKKKNNLLDWESWDDIYEDTGAPHQPHQRL